MKTVADDFLYILICVCSLLNHVFCSAGLVVRSLTYVLRMFVCASLQSCDGSEYTLQGPAGGDDITGLSAEPAHYQLLSELGKETHPSIKTS